MRVNLPKCAVCGAGSPRVVGNGHGGHRWLCADCEWKAEHPEDAPMPTPPRARRAKPLQSETLFDVDALGRAHR
jgi:hypothetical protein